MCDPTVRIERYFTSDTDRKGVAFTDASHYANPAIDQLFADIAIEGDAARRRARVDCVQDILSEDLPVKAISRRSGDSGRLMRHAPFLTRPARSPVDF
jgi:hypothetical protein